MSEQEFTLTFRGYDKDEVDNKIHQLLSEISLLRQSSKQNNNEVDRLRNEVTSLKQKLKNSTNLGYADLGSQFESTLRLAEEQAKKLISDAGQEAIKIRDTARAEGDQSLRKAEQLAQKLVAESEQRVNELKLETATIENVLANKKHQTEQQVADMLLKAKQESAQFMAEAKAEAAKVKAQSLNELEDIKNEMAQNRAAGQELLRQAQAKASELIAEAKAQISADRIAATQEIESITQQVVAKQNELDVLNHQIQQEKIQADLEIAEKRHQTEREASEMYQRTIEGSEEIMKRAEALLADSSARAQDITAQAESTLRQAEIQASNLSETTNRNAFHMINESRRRSELLTRKAESYALKAIRDAEDRASRLQHEYDDINEFLDSLKSLMSTEAVVSVVESTALALSAEENIQEAKRSAKFSKERSQEVTVDAELIEE